MYIHENHLGGLYTTEDHMNHEICEQCGDCDWEIGFAKNRQELKSLLEGQIYADEYIEEFINETFPLGGTE